MKQLNLKKDQLGANYSPYKVPGHLNYDSIYKSLNSYIVCQKHVHYVY